MSQSPDPKGAPTAGGMAVAVKAALKNRNGMWFGWSGEVSDEPNAQPKAVEVNKVTYVLIDLSKNDVQEYYNGLANSVLWPILHYRVDLQEYSTADASRLHPGQPHVRRPVEPAAPGGRRHLGARLSSDACLARELRARGHRNRIGFYLHTPCAPPDILQTLPHHEDIFGSLVDYDLVGFQTENDRDNFARYLEALGATKSRNCTYETNGRQVRLGTFPVSIETKAYQRLARNAGRSAMVALVRESLGGNRLLLGVDRLDYSKGISGPHQGVRALSRGQPGLARQGDAVADHAKEPVRGQGVH